MFSTLPQKKMKKSNGTFLEMGLKPKLLRDNPSVVRLDTDTKFRKHSQWKLKQSTKAPPPKVQFWRRLLFALFAFTCVISTSVWLCTFYIAQTMPLTAETFPTAENFTEAAIKAHGDFGKMQLPSPLTYEAFECQILSEFSKSDFPSAYSPPITNRSATNEASVILWHRIPKTGSEVMTRTIEGLAPTRNRTKVWGIGLKASVSVFHETFAFEKLSVERRNELIGKFKKVRRRTCRNATICVIADHFSFFHLPQSPPLWLTQVRRISMVRNPIRRIESFYYYIRGQSGGWRANMALPKVRRKAVAAMNQTNNLTLKQCAFSRTNECALSVNYLVHWFCAGCNPAYFVDETALRSAMQNVDDYFDAVLLLDEFQMSAALLRAIYPRLFSKKVKWGVFPQLFQEAVDSVMRSKRAQGYSAYAKMEEDSEEYLRLAAANKFDIVFFNWLKARFYSQLLQVPERKQFLQMFPQLLDRVPIAVLDTEP